MFPELDISQLVSPEEQSAVPIPQAAATRLWVEIERYRNLMEYHLGYTPYESPLPVLSARIAECAHTVGLILDPSKDATVPTKTLVDHLHGELADDLVEKYRTKVSDGLRERTITELSAQLWSIAPESLTPILDVLRATARQIQASQEYIRDADFYVLVRRSITPASYANAHLIYPDFAAMPDIQRGVIDILRHILPVPEQFDNTNLYLWDDHLDRLAESPALHSLTINGTRAWLEATQNVLRANCIRMFSQEETLALLG